MPSRANALPFLALAASVMGASIARADTPSWLRSENRHVREGNARLAAGDAKAALSEYDKAARELPSEGGVHLDRGLALLRSGQLPAAREAFRLANQPSASPQVRADASHDLGVAFYREGEALAVQEKHDEAQKMFREAQDAFKHALRMRAGDRNAAWNYELAQRRVREAEAKQKEQQQNERPENEKEKDENQQPQDQEQKQDGDQQAQQPKDKPDPSAQQGNESKPGADEPPKSPDEQQAQEPSKPPQAKQEPEKTAEAPGESAQQPAPADHAMKPEMARALDALEGGEKNLERVRAQQRANRERRRPEKDW